MKKVINLVILISFIFVLTSCFQDNKAIDNAKKELLNIDQGINSIDNQSIKKEDEIVSKKEEKQPVDIVKEVKKEKKYIIENLTSNNFIELDTLDWKDFNNWEIEITWKTLLNVDKIEVSFINKTSEFPIDNYTLKQFKSWDKTFKYRAFSRYQTLDYWKNEYVFTAYSWKDISKLSLIINIERPSDNINTKVEKVNNDKIVYEKKKIWSDNISYLNFPRSNTFWEMVTTWNNSFTYSKIDNFNVEKRDVSSIDCSNITTSLKDTVNGWFFWNTCRDIIKDKWIKFNVIRLDKDKYIYERHYVDYNNSLYGVFIIETWTWVTKDNIKAKNNELKAKTFNSIDLVDNLFYEIVR